MKNYNEYIGQKWVYIENDCIAVVKKILAEKFKVFLHEIKLPAKSNICEIKQIFKQEAKDERWFKLKKGFEGCVALFYDRKDDPFHIALLIDEDTIIHCPGTVKNPGQIEIVKLRDLPKIIYKRVEFYAYCPYK